VVTLIEILSPANKQPGADQETYLRKRQEVLSSRTSLVEIDRLHGGDRGKPGREVKERVEQFDPTLEYLVLVQRSWRRGSHLSFQLFPVYLMKPLPAIAAPLREHEAEVALDLQYAFQQTYDRGPYRRGAVDYRAAPCPPLPDEMAAWARGLVENAPARS
jgi:hypothetical protein